MRVYGIIPARLESKRLPGKAIIDIAGKPMIQWVYERSLKAELLDEVFIATDSEEIAETGREFTDNIIMTSPHHQTGTDRVAEAVSKVGGDVVINIQGDEPLIEGDVIDAITKPLIEGVVEMTTAAVEWNEQSISNPNYCKVVLDKKGNALYFSRAVIPHSKERSNERKFLKHIGIYGFTGEFLLEFSSLPRGRLEMIEGLEMLRALEYGHPIKVISVEYESIGVDTDYELKLAIDRLKG